jgi:hypothetical protein
VYNQLLAMACESLAETLAQLNRMYTDNMETLRPYLPARYDAAFSQAADMVRDAFADGRAYDIEVRRPPLLLYSIGCHNLVAHRGQFFAVPQSLGPIDLEQEDVTGRPGVMVAANLQELEARLDAAAGAAAS